MAKGDDRGEDRPGGGSGGGGGGEEPEERTDGWMTTYADMVTLLMTFFVLMFAISNVDQQKGLLFFGGLSRGGLSMEQYIDIVDRFGPSGEDDPFGDLYPYPYPSHEPDTDPDDGSGDEAGNEALTDLYNIISGYISDMGLGEQIGLEFTGEYLLLTLASDIWFISGSADVTAEMRERAQELGQLLYAAYSEEHPFEIVVAGHTDNVPVNTVRFPSNWHVSVARAVNFLEILIDASGLEAQFFYARGCGEERPIADNDTAEGRQRNRRVEVMVSLEREDHRAAFGY